MAYGHAERNLALIRQLEAETRQLLASRPQPDQEQPVRPEEADSPGGKTAAVPGAKGRVDLVGRLPARRR